MSKTSALTKFLDRFWYLKQAWAIFKTKYIDLAVLELLSGALLLIIVLIIAMTIAQLFYGFDGFYLDKITLASAENWLVSVRNMHSATFWQLRFSAPVLLAIGLLTPYSSFRTIAFLVVVDSKREEYRSKLKTLLRDNFWALTVASLVSGLITLAGLTLFVLPGVWLTVGFVFLPYFIVLGKLPLWPAIAASIKHLYKSFQLILGLIVLYILFNGLSDLVFEPDSIAITILNGIASWIISSFMALSILIIYRHFTESKDGKSITDTNSNRLIKWSQAFAILGVVVVLVATVAINLATQIVFNTDFIDTLR